MYKVENMPETPAKEVYGDSLEIILLFGVIAIVFNWYARSRRFFVLTYPPLPSQRQTLKFKAVASVFLIYLGAITIMAPILARLVTSFYSLHTPPIPPPLATMGWIQLAALLITLFLFYLYCKTQDSSMIRKIWKDRSLPGSLPIPFDFAFGVMTWLISFPVVIVIGQIADLLLYYFFGVLNYEQVAVRYLKMTLSSPPMLIVALFTILIAAPVIEEFLFRGFLQTYFKHHLGKIPAIFLAGLCFALFHLAPSQGLGNISLIVSLFAFSCYLGFIYEKRGSLFASIGLHMTFNAVSTFRILFFPES